MKEDKITVDDSGYLVVQGIRAHERGRVFKSLVDALGQPKLYVMNCYEIVFILDLQSYYAISQNDCRQVEPPSFARLEKINRTGSLI